MTFHKLLIQGLGRDAAVKRLKTYPILTARIDLFFIHLVKFGSAITEYILFLRLKAYGRSSICTVDTNHWVQCKGRPPATIHDHA